MHRPRSHYVDSSEFSRTFHSGLYWFDRLFGLRQSDQGIARDCNEDAAPQADSPLQFAPDRPSAFVAPSLQVLPGPDSDPLVPNLHNLIDQAGHARDTRWMPFNHRMEEWL